MKKIVNIDTGIELPDGKPLIWSFDSTPIQTEDDGIAFLISQLTYLESMTYEAMYREIEFTKFVTPNYSDPDYVQSITYLSYDTVTSASAAGSNSEDMPEAKLNAYKSVIPVFLGHNAYSYSLEELRISQNQRMPLDTILAEAALRGYQEKAQKTAYFGDADRNIYGLFNNPTLQSGKKVGTVDWNTASNDEIVQDMNNLLVTLWNESNQTFLADTLILPPDRWTKISSTRMDSGTDTTILKFFEENNLYTQRRKMPLMIDQSIEIGQAASGTETGNGRMMAYMNQERYLTMRIPIAWRSLAPQLQGVRFKIPCEFKIGGVDFRYLQSAKYQDFETALVP